MCRNVDVHIDVRDIKHGEDPAPRRQYLADVGNAVIDVAIARSDERIVGDVDPIQFEIMVGRLERMLEPLLSSPSQPTSRLSPPEAPADARQRLPSSPAILQQRLGSIHLLLGENDLRVRLIGVGTGFGDCPFCQLCLRLRFLQGRLQIARIHDGNDLAARDPVAFIDSQFENTPGELRCDIDRIGLSAVARSASHPRTIGAKIQVDLAPAAGHWKSSPYGCNQPSNVTSFVEACPIRNIFAEALCSQQHSGEANMNPTPLECLYGERRAIQQHISVFEGRHVAELELRLARHNC